MTLNRRKRSVRRTLRNTHKRNTRKRNTRKINTRKRNTRKRNTRKRKGKSGIPMLHAYPVGEEGLQGLVVPGGTERDESVITLYEDDDFKIEKVEIITSTRERGQSTIETSTYKIKITNKGRRSTIANCIVLDD